LISAAAVITAAGSGRRMQADKKKQYLLIDGVPVLELAVKSFIFSDLFGRVVITVPPGDLEYAKGLLSHYLESGGTCRLSLIEGGQHRQESVFLGLEALAPDNPEFVLIHDGARPWITPELIAAVLENTRLYGACIPVADIPDAVKTIGKTGFIEQHADKQRTKGAQTPQGFTFARLYAAHLEARKHHTRYADDAEVYMLANQSIYTIPGNPANRKITYTFDMERS
jgi:2-C-methyl-D-erythritol 4-phosphate cytidylyltransferase